MPGELSRSEQNRGQRAFLAFASYNGAAFGLVAGNTLALYAIAINMSDVMISWMASFFYLAMPFMLLAKPLIHRHGAAKVFGVCWGLRSLSALALANVPFLLFFPLPAETAAWAVLLFALLFAIVRSMGMVGHNPLLAEITQEAERPSFLSKVTFRFQVSHFVALGGLLLTLKALPGTLTLQVIMVAGAILGFLSTRHIFRIPESPALRESAAAPLTAQLFKIFKEPAPRRLTLGWIAGVSIIALIEPFVMLVLKKGYGFTNAQAIFMGILMIVGATSIAFTGGRLMKPSQVPLLLRLSSTLTALTILCFAFMPNSFPSALGPILFVVLGSLLCCFHICITQTFLSLVPYEQRLGSSTLLQIIVGLGSGLTTALIGGSILGILNNHPQLQGIDVYRTFFLIVSPLAFLLLIPIFRIPQSYQTPTIRGARVPLAPRDLPILRVLVRWSRKRPSRKP